MNSPLTPPLAYVLISHQQSCTSCGTTSTHSELFLKRYLTPRCGYGKPITHLTPTSEALLSLPVEITQHPRRTLPFCIGCIDPEQEGNPFWLAPGQPHPTHAPHAIVGLSYDDVSPNLPEAPKPKASAIRTLEDVLALLNK